MTKRDVLFYLTVFLLIFAYTFTAAHFDFDLWARLIAGMGVVDGGEVLKSDFISYTPVHTWFDHEWGSGVIFYTILKLFGPYGLLILQALLFFGIIFICSKIIKLKTQFSPYNLLFYFISVMAVMVNFNHPVRCHMFSFLFFVLFIYIFELVRRGNNKLLYLIPVIIIFWNNIHGGVVSGLGLTAMYAIGEYLNKKPYKKYLITLLISSVLLVINPWGIKYLDFLLKANTMTRTYIVEWWGIFSKYHLFKYLIFKIYMLGMIILEGNVLFKNIKSYGIKKCYENTDKVKFIILLSTLYLSVLHVKLLPFFVLSSLIFLYDDFYRLTEKIKFPISKLLISVLIFFSVFSLVVKELSLPVGMNTYPVKEVEFIKINNLKGKILANFGYGSYIAYKLYPRNLVFMDGRYEEVYYDFMVPMLKEFLLTYPHMNEMFEYFPPDIILVEKSYPVFNYLNKSNGWKLVYEGDLFGVFVPEAVAKGEYLQPDDNIKYYKNTLFSTGIKFKQ